MLSSVAEISQQILSLKHELRASQQGCKLPGLQSCAFVEPDFEEDTTNAENWPAEKPEVEEPISPPAPRLCASRFTTNQSTVSPVAKSIVSPSHGNPREPATLLTGMKDLKIMQQGIELLVDPQGVKETSGSASSICSSPSLAAARQLPSEGSNQEVGILKPRRKRVSGISVISGLSSELATGDVEASRSLNNMLTLRSESSTSCGPREDYRRNWSQQSLATTASSCAISPDSCFRLACDLTSICALLVYSIMLPFSRAYQELNCLCFSAFQEACFHLADAALLINVVLNFFMGYHSSDGSIQMSLVRTALKYTLTWFAFDATVAFPYMLAKRFATRQWIMWLFTLVKVVGMCRVASIFERIQREHQLNRVRVAKAMLGLVVPAHLMACGFRLACSADQAPDPMSDLMHIYVKDLYFVMMTMTTIGYGDVVPIGVWSRAYAIFVMLIASVFFGVLVSVTAHTTRSIIDNPHQHRVNAAASFLRARGVPKGLLTKVSYLMVQHLQKGHSTSLEPELFKGLTGSVQRELSLCMLGKAVLQFPLFEGAQRSLIGDLAQLYSWVSCARGDLIAEDGQMVCEITFVISGTLVAALGKYSLERHLDRNTEDVQADREKAHQMNGRPSEDCIGGLLSINEGAWFGEGCLFEKERIRTSTITSRSASNLASLSSVSYHDVIGRYPHVKQRHLSIQAALDVGQIDLADLGHGL